MADISFPGRMTARAVYASTGEAAVGPSSAARASMLSNDGATGVPYMTVLGGEMLNGGFIALQGQGLIGAPTANANGFTLIPWFAYASSPATKIDLPGFTYAPLLGTDGTCEIWLRFTQTASGLRSGGVVRYGAANAQAYSILVNPGALGTPPSVVASDPTLDRIIGVDGQWTTSNAACYVRCRQTAAELVMRA